MTTGLTITAGIAGGVLLLVAPVIGRGNQRRSIATVLAGADARLIRTSADRARIASMGCMVAFTALAAGASIVVALQLMFPDGKPIRFLPAGLVWAAIVLTIDRWIVSHVDHRDLTDRPPSSRPWRDRATSTGAFALQLLSRLAMAAVVGQLIAAFLLLAIYKPEIDQELHDTQEAASTSTTAQIDARFAAMPPTVTAQNEQAAQDAATAAATAQELAHQVYLCEKFPTAECIAALPPGSVSGEPGNGPETDAALAAWNNAITANTTAQTALTAAQQANAGPAADLQSQRDQAVEDANRDIAANTGLAARQEALDAVIADNPSLRYQRWLIIAAIMLVDLLPLLFKTLTGATTYSRLERAEAIALTRDAERDAHEDSDLQRDTRRAQRAMARAALPVPPPVAQPAGAAGDGVGQGDDHGADAGEPADVPAGEPAGGQARDAWGPMAGEPAQAGGQTAGDVVGGRWQCIGPLVGAVHSTQLPPFRARDLRGEYPGEVIVKFLAAPSSDLRARRHALAEMSFPVGFVHENLAENLDSHIDPVFGFYIVTRRYPYTLETWTRDERVSASLTLGQCLDLVTQIFSGLQAAWSIGFVHLDIKPANIALDDEGTVKIIDFGISRHYLQHSGHQDPVTSLRFSTFYAPLEQLTNKGAAARTADIWAVAATLYCLLTGRPPMFREAQAAGLIDPETGALQVEQLLDFKQLMGMYAPLPLSALLPDVPPLLDDTVRRWLNTDPDQRHPGNAEPERFNERLQIVLSDLRAAVLAARAADMAVGLRAVVEPDVEIDADWRSGGRRRPRRQRRRNVVSDQRFTGPAPEVTTVTRAARLDDNTVQQLPPRPSDPTIDTGATSSDPIITQEEK